MARKKNTTNLKVLRQAGTNSTDTVHPLPHGSRYSKM